MATSVGGVHAVLGEGKYGALVHPGNPAMLTRAISESRQNISVGRKKAEKAKQIALSKYSSRQMAEDYNRIYRKVVRNGKYFKMRNAF